MDQKHRRNSMYVCQRDDTIERVAAKVNSTPGHLKSINKLTVSLLYPGQMLTVPDAGSEESDHRPTHALENRPRSKSSSIACVEKATTKSKFLRIQSKFFTDNEGTVPGVLLLTPNSIMFDPDLMHSLIVEKGATDYTVNLSMNSLVSVALYENLPLTTEAEDSTDAKENPFCGRMRENLQNGSVTTNQNAPSLSNSNSDSDFGSSEVSSSNSSASNSATAAENFSASNNFALEKDENDQNNRTISVLKHRDSAFQDDQCNQRTSVSGQSDQCNEKTDKYDSTSDRYDPASDKHDLKNDQMDLKNAANDLTNDRSDQNTVDFTLLEEIVTQDLSNESESIALMRTAATNFRHSLTQEPTGQLMPVVQVVDDDHMTTKLNKIVSSIPVSATENAIEARESPSFNEFCFVDSEGTVLDQSAERKLMRRNETIEKLREKTREIRNQTRFFCALSESDRPADLFAHVEEHLPYPQQMQAEEIRSELPHYLCMKVSAAAGASAENGTKKFAPDDAKEFADRQMNNTDDDVTLFKSYWFTIPKNEIPHLHSFFLHFLPDKLLDAAPKSYSRPTEALFDFVFLDKSDDKNFNKSTSTSKDSGSSGTSCPTSGGSSASKSSESGGSSSSSFFLNMNLNRQWEIVTVEEVKRRLSFLDQQSESETMWTLPDESDRPSFLDDQMISDILHALPPRIQGYPWIMVYSSEIHGFCLNTLYRNMSIAKDISPSLLLIRDSRLNVFGALISSPLRLSDQVYGSGESFLFTFHPATFKTYRWSHHNSNDYIAKGTKECLIIGASHGNFGLWLDSDLNRGRTSRCKTFNNNPLTDSEDFFVKSVEAFIFFVEK